MLLKFLGEGTRLVFKSYLGIIEIWKSPVVGSWHFTAIHGIW